MTFERCSTWLESTVLAGGHAGMTACIGAWLLDIIIGMQKCTPKSNSTVIASRTKVKILQAAQPSCTEGRIAAA